MATDITNSNQNNPNNNNENQHLDQENVQENEQQTSFFMKMFYFFCIYTVLNIIITNVIPKAPNPNGVKNAIKLNSTFNINFYISNKGNLIRNDLKNLKPDAVIEDVIYNINGEVDTNTTDITINYKSNSKSLGISSKFPEKGETKLFLYSEINFNDHSLMKDLKSSFTNEIYVDKLTLLKFSPNLKSSIKIGKSMDSDTLNVEEFTSSTPNSSSTNNTNVTDTKEIPDLYYYPEITLYLNSYESDQDLSAFEELRVMQIPYKVHFKNNIFAPNSYLNTFWCMLADMKPVLDGDNEFKINVSFRYISNFKYKYMRGLEINSQMMEKNFAIPASKDMMVELLKNNSAAYLAIMFGVNIAHTIFSILGFASEINYYKNLKKLDGVYTKEMFFRLFQLLVALIYISTEESHFIVKIELFIAAFIEVWKLKKIFSFEFTTSPPFINIGYKLEFRIEKSKEYETDAISIMFKFLFCPLAIIYLVYRIYYYSNNVTIFKFILGYIFFLMNIFGFILMTPQIYLNYKLKSVEHMPFKALIFKFLNTIMDDLYAFAVKTPTLYRIFVFKDDVIFCIFIYQIIAYRNNTRTNTNQEEDNLKYKSKSGKFANSDKDSQFKSVFIDLIDNSLCNFELDNKKYINACETAFIVSSVSLKYEYSSRSLDELDFNTEEFKKLSGNNMNDVTFTFNKDKYELINEIEKNSFWEFGVSNNAKRCLIIKFEDLYVFCSYSTDIKMDIIENDKILTGPNFQNTNDLKKQLLIIRDKICANYKNDNRLDSKKKD